MNEFKGTKGKWIIYKKDQVICDGSTVGDFENLLRSHKERQANALLFLNSREMLEMLIKWNSILESDGYDNTEIEQIIKQATTI